MNNASRLFLVLVGPLLFLCSCKQEKPTSLRIAVSANAEPLVSALLNEFDSDPPLVSDLILGSSGQLSAQIANGAPIDIFLAADTIYPNYLFTNGFSQEPPQVYGEGILVLMAADTLPRPAMLDSDAIKSIVIAKPELAPYGKASKEFLQNTGRWQAVESKLVYAENALQAAVFTHTKAADIGFGALSVALNLDKKHKGYYTVLDTAQYSPIIQAALLIKREQQTPQAQAFYEFIFSETGRELILQYGYKLPD